MAAQSAAGGALHKHSTRLPLLSTHSSIHQSIESSRVSAGRWSIDRIGLGCRFEWTVQPGRPLGPV